MSTRCIEWKNVASTRFAGQTSKHETLGKAFTKHVATQRENTAKTFPERDKKRDANDLMPKPSKKLFKQTPFVVKVLLFLAKFGVNINRPPPPSRTIAVFVSVLTFVLLLACTKRTLSNGLFFSLTNEKPDLKLVRCARTFPAVASHQLFTAEPLVKSGGKEALDYLRDGFQVRNFDIGARRRII